MARPVANLRSLFDEIEEHIAAVRNLHLNQEYHLRRIEKLMEGMRMKKICLDAGHGGGKPGAVYGGLNEKDVNLAIALRAGAELTQEGDKVIYTRKDDSDVSLQERCDIANREGCDLFVSIHCNADPDSDEAGDPEAHGEEIWYKSERGKKLAQALSKSVDAFFPSEPYRGIKQTDNLYVLNQTNMPAVLIEVGFIDASSSNESFKDPETIKSIAGLIASGIFLAEV
jgi:N-acetylmuramoyl-L-alanine amidase